MLKFVESGRKGTVVMSLGTNIKSNMLGNETLANILRTFAELPDYNFVWKFESEPHQLPLQPTRNVLLGKFLPQNDILAHPNVKAFVTHSGLLSVQEALWHGKPLIGIPFFCDQYRTIGKMVGMSLAVEVDWQTLSDAETFKAAILKVLETPSYTTNAQKLSKLFQDKPQKPLDVAVWWIEYAIRNPKTEHLRSPTLDLGVLASSSLDVLLTVAVLPYISLIVVKKLFKLLFGRKKLAKAKQN